MRLTSRRKPARALLAILASMLMLAGPFGAPALAQDNQAPDKTVLRVALVQEIDHLNPFLAIFASSTGLGRLSYEFLTLPSAEDALPTGGLAESWEYSDDKLTWTFHIRKGMTWSDGKPITAHDAAYTFNRMLDDPKARTANGSYVANFESVEATDDHTLVIKTAEPQSSMTALDVPIVPKHVWQNYPKIDDPRADQAPVVGSGPFIMTEWERGEYVRLEANKNYWRGAPKVDELLFLQFDSADAAVAALRNDEVDLVNRLTPAQFDSLKGAENITTNKAPNRRYNELLMNPGAATADGQPIGDGHPALEDVKVRRAIATAIDKKVIADKVVGGYAQVGAGLVPPVFDKYHWQPAPDQRYGFDPAKANAMLDAADYPRGPDGIRVGPDGKRLEFRLTGRATETFDQRAAEYIKGWLADIGIAVNLELVSDNQVNEVTTAGNYDLALSGWGTSPDPDYVLALQVCDNRPNPEGGGGTTATFFCDEQYDSLYQQQRAEFDPDKRAEIVKQAQARFHEQVPSVILTYNNALEAYRSDNFTGFATQPQPEGVIMEQSGYWGYYGATPAEDSSGGSGGNTGMWVGLGAAVLVVLVGGGVLYGRRNKSAEDRE